MTALQMPQAFYQRVVQLDLCLDALAKSGGCYQGYRVPGSGLTRGKGGGEQSMASKAISKQIKKPT